MSKDLQYQALLWSELGLLFSLSTTFSKAQEKKEKAADEKEAKRQKRIAELEAEASKKAPHLTGRR